ncbi:MAG: ECF transporter S component [Candidatus Heimdallarchaeota archaeon]|nr:ECF transporter S component [Candidatus Heimdallarchaeota archaeon]
MNTEEIQEEIILRERLVKEVNSIRSIALIVTFTGLVFLSTSIFYLNIASSSGFFNIGEAFIYLAALIGGPVTGSIAGGVGAALADLALGYGIYAPATFILKAVEGFVVGYLFYLIKRVKKWIQISVVGILSAFMITFSAIFTNQSFNVETTFYGNEDKIYSLTIPGYVLLIIALVLCILMIIATFFLGEKGEMAISCSLGGMIIVVGYFIYQAFILGVGAGGAAIEIPFNIAQVFFGAAIAIPIVSYLRQLGIIHSDEDDDEALIENEEETVSDQV